METCKVWIESVERKSEVAYAQRGFRKPFEYEYRAHVVAVDALENRHYFSVHYDTIRYEAGSGMGDYLRQFWEDARFKALGYTEGVELDLTGRFTLCTSKATLKPYYKVTHVQHNKATEEQLAVATASFTRQLK